MTLFQINTSTLEDLIIFFKNKARCFHSRSNADRVWLVIQERVTDYDMDPLKLALWHMQNEGSTADYEIFDFECDALLAHHKKYMKDTSRILTKMYLEKRH